MFVVSFTDHSGKFHEQEYQYESPARLFYEHLKEYYPESNPVIIEK
jgi:hypothetical protein